MSSSFLVDSQAVLWWLGDDARLSGSARGLMADGDNRLLVSAASIWEMAIKRSLGKLRAPADLPRIVEAEGFELLPVSAAHAWGAESLPLNPRHRDPFDRLLVVQALHERMAIISSDPLLDDYGIERRW